MGLQIIGTGRALPGKQVTNNDLSGLLNTSDDWIVSKTGIKTRYVLTNESLTDLAESAAQEAFAKACIKSADIDLVICSTMSGDFVTPSLACCVLQRLGINRPAFDVNAACSGFVYALDMASAYLDSDRAKNILIISAEAMSARVDWSDRSTCVLFGDGVGVCVTAKGDSLKYVNISASGDIEPLHIKAGTGNSPFRKNENYGFVYMDGQEVFKFAVQSIEKEIYLALNTLNITARDIDYFLLHQANKRIIDSARTRLKQPESKFPLNIDRYGNMSSASIPVLLDELIGDSKIKTGDTLLFSAFGAGMTTGTAVMVWQ